MYICEFVNYLINLSKMFSMQIYGLMWFKACWLSVFSSNCTKVDFSDVLAVGKDNEPLESIQLYYVLLTLTFILKLQVPSVLARISGNLRKLSTGLSANSLVPPPLTTTVPFRPMRTATCFHI